jgi:hypothetical protein
MTGEDEVLLKQRLALADSRLHYRGDLRGRIEGQVLGPSSLREWFVILATDYDPDTDRTTAHCGYATPDEIGWPQPPRAVRLRRATP